jgi:hypothetical protein
VREALHAFAHKRTGFLFTHLGKSVDFMTNTLFEIIGELGGDKIAEVTELFEVPYFGIGLGASKIAQIWQGSWMDDVNEEVQKILDCNHIEICKGWGTPTNLAVATVLKKKGCAFLYKSVPLWHIEPNLQVGKVSCDVIRYNRKTKSIGYNAVVIPVPCPYCHPQK